MLIPLVLAIFLMVLIVIVIDKGRGRVRTVIGPPCNFQKKAYPQMQNLMANLLVINSTHFENNLMISSTDY